MIIFNTLQFKKHIFTKIF